MPVYTVHAPVAHGADLAVTDKFVFVRDGFHVWAAVAGALDLIDHRQTGIAGTQEITVHGVHVARLLDRLAGGGNALAKHLAAEQLTKTEILAAATEQVFLDLFQAQQRDQIVEYLGHGVSPRAGVTDR